ncbi:hypothetical protein P879_08702 [Paragonimus westermani]|uniref:Sema domain-containing protein n=1 Tax=Paragonimus westermani TaxID=34504 RepID=A0A8T0D3L7_9TREM|nr:hypothetical protein P879_08702 [Paragonimus westermani]
MNHLPYSEMHLICLVITTMNILILQSNEFVDQQTATYSQPENIMEPKLLHFRKSYVFLFYEDPYIVVGAKNTIVVINTTSLASASEHVVLSWNSLDPNLCITSAFHVHINREYMPRQTQAGAVRLVCGQTGLNRTELLEDDRLMFDGMLCSYWYHPVRAIFQPWTRVHAGSVLWFALLTNTLDSKLLFAAKLLLSKHTLVIVDARTNIGIVVGYLQHVVNDKREVMSAKPWLSRFELAERTDRAAQRTATHQTAWTYKDTEIDQTGWLSNAESNLWFSDQVQFHQLAAVNEQYFYGVFTEEDILTVSDPTDNLGTRPSRMVTQVVRVCQRDPGQGKAGQFLTTNGVFTTFRKTRLRCQTSAGRQISTKMRSSSRLQSLELTRAVAVSEFVTTDNRKDHVFYALMTTSDSVTSVYGLCAFRLSDIDLALNYDRLFTWQSADVPSESWLERFLRNITPFSNPSEGEGSTLRQTTYGKSIGENIRVISQTPMTQAIANASKTCPSTTLPEYFARFATQHPHVASSVLAFAPNSPDSRSAEALVYFRLPTTSEHAIEIGNPTSLVVDWSSRSTDVDKVYIGTGKPIITNFQSTIVIKLMLSFISLN